MMEITKTGVIELPVVVISTHSTLAQLRRSWCSTITVAVKDKGQAGIIRHVNGRDQLEEQSALKVRNNSFFAGVIFLSPLSDNELYAKDLIDMNGGIVEVGSGWPPGEPKPKELCVVCLDKPPLLGLDGKWKDQTTLPHPLQFMLLIGDRFVDALDMYHQQRWLLMSSLVLPLHEQQVAHELKRLLVIIIKNLLNNRQFLDNLTQGCSEEHVLVSIINILVDVQLYDNKKGASSKTLQLLLSNGDLAASENYSGIVKHKVVNDLITILQSVLAFRLPSKETADSTQLDGMEKGDEAREKASYMRGAMFDIIVLLKHMEQAGDVLAESHREDRVSTALFKSDGNNEMEGRRVKRHEDVEGQMLEIEWKMLLAVLGKKDLASFQNVLLNIRNEKQQQILEMMAGPLGLIALDSGEKLTERPWIVGALATDSESGVQANVGAKQMQTMGVEQKKKENGSNGYYVKSDKKVSHQKRRNNSDQILQSKIVNQREILMESGCFYQSISSKELESQCTSIQENVSQCTDVQGHDCRVVRLPTEHADASTREEGAGGQSQNQMQTHSSDEAHKTDWESNTLLNASLQADQLPTNIDLHVMDPTALSSSQAAHHHEFDLFVESPLQNVQLQTPLESHGTDQTADYSNTATSSCSVNEAAAGDACISDPACVLVPSSGQQATAYGGDNDDDHHYNDSKVRRRKRKYHRPHRARENQELQHVPYCQRGRCRSSLTRIFPFVIIVIVLPITMIGIIWFHSVSSTNSNFGDEQCRAFAKGYLP